MKTELRKFFPERESLNFIYEVGSCKTFKVIESKPICLGEHYFDKEVLTEAIKRGLVTEPTSNGICNITLAGTSEFLRLIGVNPETYKRIQV